MGALIIIIAASACLTIVNKSRYMKAKALATAKLMHETREAMK